MQGSNEHLQLPSGTRMKLEEFRRRVWTIKLIEGVLAAVFGLCISYLVVFILDRFMDTPAVARSLILICGSVGLAIWLPIVWHRWVWRTQRLEQVAKIVSHTFPRLGDQLLGVVELVNSREEQNRSEALCRAALKQVDKETQRKDFSDAVPNPRHQHWAWAAGVPVALALAALLVVPAAGKNAMARWLMPWKNTERYTFAQLNDLKNEQVVPYGEEFDLTASLSKDSVWSPVKGSARYGKQPRIESDLKDGKYGFTIPPQDESQPLRVRVGDDFASIDVKPTARPELTTMMASCQLPEYLQYSQPQQKDVRGG